MTNYRSLVDKEIATLIVYGCSAENWKEVQVANDFSPAYIQNVHFSGTVFLGTYQKVFELQGGVKKHAGIYNCLLHNCKVGNDVFIDKINNYIANCDISDAAFIENVNLILNEGESTFGNAVKVSVMIESGAREISIFDYLSAPLAYVFTFYRHKNTLITALAEKIKVYSLSQKSEKSLIGKNARITNCGTLKNVRIGNSAIIEGALLLENGTINCTESAPVYIGYGVQCNNFIINSGSIISESALVSNCFIGQGCLISKQFSAVDSLFFANCQGLHGEAVSIFAGPYTVTHHKSTLMLTALYSFMNAGSGTNFSNHMYKLGPVHQGVTERGVKTSSNSYIMWPAKIGAFTVILGRHKGNSDISDLPFSYLIENDGESNLLPGINLHSSGTMRDVQKWPKRDNRTDQTKLDPLNFDFLSPYTLSKVLNGIKLLKELLLNTDVKTPFVWYQNCKLKRSSIKKGIELYEMALAQFVGYKLVEKLNIESFTSFNELAFCLASNTENGKGNWVDMAGLIAPKIEVEKLILEIENQSFSLEDIQNSLNNLQQNYLEYSWNWSIDILEKQLEKPLASFTASDLINILDEWKKSVLTFNDLILRDAKKEFNSISKTGFGIDGDDEQKNIDFEFTRGLFDDNSFVKEIMSQSENCSQIAAKLSIKLKQL